MALAASTIARKGDCVVGGTSSPSSPGSGASGVLRLLRDLRDAIDHPATFAAGLVPDDAHPRGARGARRRAPDGAEARRKAAPAAPECSRRAVGRGRWARTNGGNEGDLRTCRCITRVSQEAPLRRRPAPGYPRLRVRPRLFLIAVAQARRPRLPPPPPSTPSATAPGRGSATRGPSPTPARTPAPTPAGSTLRETSRSARTTTRRATGSPPCSRRASTGRPRQPVDPGPARRAARRLLLAPRRPLHALPRVLESGGRDLLGAAADGAHEYAGHPATRTRTRSGSRPRTGPTCSGAAATTTRPSRSRTTARPPGPRRAR